MTSARPKRLVGELSSDPARLHLHYGHGHPAVPYDFEGTLESWYVKVTYGMAGDEEWEDEGSRAPAAGTEVGHVILWRLRDYTGDNRWEAADAESGDLAVIASAVLGRSGRAGYSAAFEKAVTHRVGDLLILDRVHLDRAWRGFGLGPILAAEAIRRLSGGCCAVAAYPDMAGYPEDREQLTEACRRQAKKKIAALWESIGFQRLGGDPAGVTLADVPEASGPVPASRCLWRWCCTGSPTPTWLPGERAEASGQAAQTVT
ncbi:hypothetical protein [Streptomyces mirabilis]|uniref:hypothetical protein n=1 Tax=Streptomyces mirabilis TaxID=68239 RepID=UPI00369EDE17